MSTVRDARLWVRLQTRKPELVRCAPARPNCHRSKGSSLLTGTYSRVCGRVDLASSPPLRLSLVTEKQFSNSSYWDCVDAARRLSVSVTLWRVRAVWRRPNLEPVYGYRCVPELPEYWGPNGMVFFRNVQVRWMPLRSSRGASPSPGAAWEPARTKACTQVESNCKA